LKVEQLCDECLRQGLDIEGTVRKLRQRLKRQLKDQTMENKQEDIDVQAGAAVNLPIDAPARENQGRDWNFRAPDSCNHNPVFVELMRQVPPLTSEEPEAISRFIARLEEVYVLGLR
jgi:hypothetical protein